MVIARSTKETFEYVCVSDRELPESEQTVFTLRHLPATVGMSLDNLHEGDQKGHVTLKVGDQKIVALMAGLAGWRNFNKADGSVVEFRRRSGERSILGITVTDPAERGMIDHLPIEVADELAAVIRGENTVTEDDAKKPS